MIDIDIATDRRGKPIPGRLTVTLSAPSQQAVAAVQSLLSAYYSDAASRWMIGTADFRHFVDQLDTLKAPDSGEMTPEAKAEIDAYDQRRIQLLALKKAPTDTTLLKQIKGWKTKPYDDQLQCLKFHIERRRSLEAGETGIGKTLILLYAFLYWKSVAQAKKGLILCINSGKLDWTSEVKQHTNLKALCVGNGTENVLDDLRIWQKGKHDLLICHYDCLYADAKSTVRVFDTFKSLPFDFVALDEVHTLKNPDAKRHKRIMELVKRWDDIPLICATGTAIDGNPKSAWTPLQLVEGGSHYFPSYQLFYNHFVIRQKRYFGRHSAMVEIGFKNLQTLKDLLEPASIRFLKSEVMNRPSKIFQTRIARMTPGQEKIYAEVKRVVRAEILSEEQAGKSSLVDASTRMLRLRQILNHPTIAGFTKFDGDSGKHRELDEVIEEILSNPEAQILVWTQWRDGVDILVERYKEYGSVAFYGGSDDAEIRDLVLSKKVRVVIAIPEKAGTSIDWLKVCRTAVYLEKPWYLPLYRQSLDRIDRRANVDPALIISIEVENSVDQLVNTVLKRRQDVFDALTLEDEKLVALDKSELLDYLK